MRRTLSLSLFALLVATSFAACDHPTTFEGHDIYAPSGMTHSAAPGDLSPYTCSAAEDCDFWLCTCADGTIVAAAVCDSSYCLLAPAACGLACDVLGDGAFSGTAEGGPGSGIGKPDDTDQGAGGKGSGSCFAEGDACTYDDDCCGGQCDGGVCSSAPQCGVAGDPCGNDGDCCEGACGGDGVCAVETCQSTGDTCVTNGDCCSLFCDSAGYCG